MTLYPQTTAPISGIWVIFSVTHLFSRIAQKREEKKEREGEEKWERNRWNMSLSDRGIDGRRETGGRKIRWEGEMRQQRGGD